MQLTRVAEASALGKALVAGELFVSLVRGPVRSLVTALGARSKVTAMLDASVGMHLAPSALCEAIGLLNFGQPVGNAEAATG